MIKRQTDKKDKHTIKQTNVAKLDRQQQKKITKGQLKFFGCLKS